jgi:hypothetical protein
MFVGGGKGEIFVPARLCCGPHHVGPVFEALPAWMAGTSPAMTTRAETKSKRYENHAFAWQNPNGVLHISAGRIGRAAPGRRQKGEEV